MYCITKKPDLQTFQSAPPLPFPIFFIKTVSHIRIRAYIHAEKDRLLLSYKRSTDGKSGGLSAALHIQNENRRRLDNSGAFVRFDKIEKSFSVCQIQSAAPVRIALAVGTDDADCPKIFELVRNRGLVYVQEFAQIGNAHFGDTQRRNYAESGGIGQRGEKVRERAQAVPSQIVLSHEALRVLVQKYFFVFHLLSLPYIFQSVICAYIPDIYIVERRTFIVNTVTTAKFATYNLIKSYYREVFGKCRPTIFFAYF